MRGQLIEQTASAYRYPLLIKELLKSGVTRAPAQEIVHGNARRMAYRELDERVGRLASGLAGFAIVLVSCTPLAVIAVVAGRLRIRRA